MAGMTGRTTGYTSGHMSGHTPGHTAGSVTCGETQKLTRLSRHAPCSAVAPRRPTIAPWNTLRPYATPTLQQRRHTRRAQRPQAMKRRDGLRAVGSLWALGALMTTTPTDTRADASGRALASYYARHQWLSAGGVAHTWRESGTPQRAIEGVVQVGVSQDAFFALRANGELVRWADAPPQGARMPSVLMRGVAQFAAGQSGWMAIDAENGLWYRAASGATNVATTRGATDVEISRVATDVEIIRVAADVEPTRVATDVAVACVGDSADYYITRAGALFVKGLAHRGQYGDGRLTATAQFVPTAGDAVAVKAHTGHAIHLKRDGGVYGTGGNRFGPLSAHGLGDKADRWGLIFEGATAIATGSRHSAALRADGSLWAWGEGFAIAPRKILDEAVEVAAGDTATLALTRSGALWQWERGVGPRRLSTG